jgi:predicted RNase H-like HicB family nuclease
MQYVVVYERTPHGWSAYVPDLPGCVAAGDSRDEVEVLLREAIAMHVEALREEGEPLPEPGAWTGLVEV